MFLQVLHSLFELLSHSWIWRLSAALPDSGGGGSNYTGSVGVLVAAAMETAGVFVQAEILSTFEAGMKQLAALCYLASIGGALLAISQTGNYRQALYFLIGPPLFLFMLTTKTTVAGAQLQTGDRLVPNSVESQIKFLSKYADGTKFESGAEVSYFFVGFDRVVSSVIQGVVGVILDTKNNEDLIIKGRERMFSWALMGAPKSPAFIKLVAMGTFGECADIFSKSKEILEHRLDARNRSIGDENLDDDGIYLRDRYNEEVRKKRFILDHEVIQLVTKDPQTQEKFKLYKQSCEEIWIMTHVQALHYAEQNLDSDNFLGSAGDDGITPWKKVQEEVKTALDRGQANQILAAYMIKNAMRRTAHSDLVTGIFNRVPFNAERRNETFDDVAGQHAYAGFLKTEYIALALPYIQGMLLYLLAACFPFFAIFLVMPSRANTFMIWASLWVWVKSWDIGFALVTVARKILWQFVKAAPNQFAAGNVPDPAMANTPIDWTRPETVFAIINDNDPLATQNTYFTIVSMLTAAVPLLTAHCCLGATGLWDVFGTSLNQRADYSYTRRMKAKTRVHGASPTELAQGEIPANAAVGESEKAAQDMTGQQQVSQSPQEARGDARSPK
ncbi:MAG: conjugal transfer protein TraG N-terminal domain-containing protein [Bdellovibrionota bacterium]